MRKVLIPGKKFLLWDFVIIPLQICPVHTSVKILSKILSALMPSLQVFVTADFIDTAIKIFNEKSDYNDIIPPLILLILIILYSNLTGSFMAFLNEKYDIKMTEHLRGSIVEKRARLQYCHIENNDTWDLISRTCGNLVGRITGGFNSIIDAVGIVIRVVSILAVLMFQVWWAALVIIVITIPLFSLAVKGGKATYEANKEADKHNRRAGYLHGVLSGRDTV